MSKVALNAEVSAFCHATEDLEKVKVALTNVLPEEIRAELEDSLSVSMLEGHYGNPIFVLKVKIEKPELAEALLKHLLAALPPGDLLALERTLRHRLDPSGHLYLRLDKQRAYLGEVRVYDGDDVIRVRVKLSPQARQALQSNKSLKELL
jgi:RNA binding exosome subunit